MAIRVRYDAPGGTIDWADLLANAYRSRRPIQEPSRLQQFLAVEGIGADLEKARLGAWSSAYGAFQAAQASKFGAKARLVGEGLQADVARDEIEAQRYLGRRQDITNRQLGQLQADTTLERERMEGETTLQQTAMQQEGYDRRHRSDELQEKIRGTYAQRKALFEQTVKPVVESKSFRSAPPEVQARYMSAAMQYAAEQIPMPTGEENPGTDLLGVPMDKSPLARQAPPTSTGGFSGEAPEGDTLGTIQAGGAPPMEEPSLLETFRGAWQSVQNLIGPPRVRAETALQNVDRIANAPNMTAAEKVPAIQSNIERAMNEIAQYAQDEKTPEQQQAELDQALSTSMRPVYNPVTNEFMGYAFINEDGQPEGVRSLSPSSSKQQEGPSTPLTFYESNPDKLSKFVLDLREKAQNDLEDIELTLRSITSGQSTENYANVRALTNKAERLRAIIEDPGAEAKRQLENITSGFYGAPGAPPPPAPATDPMADTDFGYDPMPKSSAAPAAPMQAPQATPQATPQPTPTPAPAPTAQDIMQTPIEPIGEQTQEQVAGSSKDNPVIPNTIDELQALPSGTWVQLIGDNDEPILVQVP